MVDITLNAINLVSAAIQKKRVAEEGETEVKTNAFYMNLRLARKSTFNTSVYTVSEASDVRVSLPSPNVVVEDLRGDDIIDVQVNITRYFCLAFSVIIIIIIIIIMGFAVAFPRGGSSSTVSRSNWNLEVLVFDERGKPEYPEKNLSEQSREPTTNSTHI